MFLTQICFLFFLILNFFWYQVRTIRQALAVWQHQFYDDNENDNSDNNTITKKSLHKKWGFPLRISSVNATKSAGK